MAMQIAQPLPNVEYGLTLGVSFAPEAGEEVETSYAALRYDFRPASADMDQPGVLLLGKDNRVSLYLANSATCEWDVLFSGKYEPYSNGGAAGTASGRDSLDCVALFDPTTGTFRLETLLGQYNTKHVRDAPPYRAPLDDHMQLSPGTSGSAGPGPSMSPTGPHPQSSQAQRRADSPLGSHGGSDDLCPTAGVPQRQAGQGHDRYGGSNGGVAGGGSSGAGGSCGGASTIGGAKPPRPPVAGGAARSGGAAAAGGSQGKKRQRDGNGGGQSPSGAPARKTSRLARSSGPQRQDQGQRAKSPLSRAQPGNTSKQTQHPGSQQQQAHNHNQQQRQLQQQPAAVAGSPAAGEGGEDDVDAELLDAFDTFDSFEADPDGSALDAGGDDGDGDGAGNNNGSVVAAAVTAAPEVAPPAAVAALAVVAPAVQPVAPLVATTPAMALTPTLETEHVQEPEEDHEEAAQPLPGARLVVDMMDDDEGYGFGAEEDDGLGIEYF